MMLAGSAESASPWVRRTLNKRNVTVRKEPERAAPFTSIRTALSSRPCWMPSSPARLATAVAGGATALLAMRHWSTVAIAVRVSRDIFMVWLIDLLPQPLRRKILSAEYSGAMLEERLTQRIFKGMPTVRALWRMGSINYRPHVRVGDAAPPTPVLLDGEATTLPELTRGERPLLINFGSSS